MPLIENEPKYSARILLAIGVPLFFLALAASLVLHQYAHAAAENYFCSAGHTRDVQVASLFYLSAEHANCPVGSLAGTLSTFAMALAGFAYFLHHPRNIFAASLAFVNATWRLPEASTVLLQLVLHQKAKLLADENTALQLLHLKDPAAAIVLLCFYSLATLFLAVIIVHDTRFLSGKWFVALALFVVTLAVKLLSVH
jgi:hypothetical protein